LVPIIIPVQSAFIVIGPKKAASVASSVPTLISDTSVNVVAAVKLENERSVCPELAFSPTVQEISPSEVIDTPSYEYPQHCLYVRDLILCRRNGEGRYLVDAALTINTTFADTGAGPSVITKSLLDSLPDDACAVRTRDDQPLQPITGPDGSPLIPRGHVALVFSISGVTFRHRFLVIEGNPMLLLGNDFLASHAAIISLHA
jgi:hypothetical protein